MFIQISNNLWCANSLNDYFSWKETGVTHRCGKKEVFKNKRLEQLWSLMDENIVRKVSDSGKVEYDVSKVTDEDILYFLNETSKALKVEPQTLEQMCAAFDRQRS